MIKELGSMDNEARPEERVYRKGVSDHLYVPGSSKVVPQ